MFTIVEHIYTYSGGGCQAVMHKLGLDQEVSGLLKQRPTMDVFR